MNVMEWLIVVVMRYVRTLYQVTNVRVEKDIKCEEILVLVSHQVLFIMRS